MTFFVTKPNLFRQKLYWLGLLSIYIFPKKKSKLFCLSIFGDVMVNSGIFRESHNNNKNNNKNKNKNYNKNNNIVIFRP